nr:MAG TPA: hypothetical protein [Caudoviricetes sp.]
MHQNIYNNVIYDKKIAQNITEQQCNSRRNSQALIRLQYLIA